VGKSGESVRWLFSPVQQVQKYERGTNHVPATRLQHVAGALDVNLGFFYYAVMTLLRV
jgi:hypothetical protein